MHRSPKLFAAAMLALPGQVAATEPSAGTPEGNAIAQFTSACFDGGLRTTADVREVQWAGIPGALRSHYRDGFSGHYYRVGDRRPSYLIVLNSTDPSGEFASVCGLAVPGYRLADLFGRAVRALGRPDRAVPSNASLSATFDNASEGYVISAVQVSDYVMLEVAHYSDAALTLSSAKAL